MTYDFNQNILSEKIYLSPYERDEDGVNPMKFRLTYTGPLRCDITGRMVSESAETRVSKS